MLHRIETIRVFATTCLVILSGCVTMYTPPEKKESPASIEVKFDYQGVDVVGKVITSYLYVAEDGKKDENAFSDMGFDKIQLGGGRKYPFKKGVVLLRPKKDTEVQAGLVYTIYGAAVTNVYICSVRYRFSPEKNKKYSLDYTTKDFSSCDGFLVDATAKGSDSSAVKKVGMRIDAKKL